MDRTDGSFSSQYSPMPKRKRPSPDSPTAKSKHSIVFITVCTKDRNPWLATTDCHELLHNIWYESTAWLAGRYVIMPNHIHLFSAPGEMDIPLRNWIQYWKRQFTRIHKQPDHQWQSGHWDTRLRTSDNYEEKWEYVQNNPVRHGLVQRPEDWPFQGEINKLIL